MPHSWQTTFDHTVEAAAKLAECRDYKLEGLLICGFQPIGGTVESIGVDRHHSTKSVHAFSSLFHFILVDTDRVFQKITRSSERVGYTTRPLVSSLSLRFKFWGE